MNICSNLSCKKGLLITFLFIALYSCKTDSEESVQKHPNIVFFIADDMRPMHFNFLPEGEGRNLTPNLDKLVEEGTIMMNQHVVSPVCNPSRFNVLSGMYSSRATNEEFIRFTEKQKGQTCIQWNAFLKPTDYNIAKALSAEGYTTGFFGKNHIIEVDSIEKFESYDVNPREPKILEKLQNNYKKVRNAILKAGFNDADGLYHNNPHFIGIDELAVHNLDWSAKAGIDFIEENKDNPFFLYFATTVPHGPEEAVRSWNSNPLFTPNGFLEDTLDVMPPRHTIAERVKEAGLEGTKRENILWIDDALGALINKLEEAGIADNTIIFFFSDHGQDAKGTLYQGGVHDPSVVWKKGGWKCGSINEALVSNIDFTPTMLDMAGIDYNASKFDGESFLPSLNGENPEGRESLYFELGFARGVRKGNWKYMAIRYPQYAMDWTLEQRDSALQVYNDGRRYRKVNIVTDDPNKPFSHLEILPGGGDAEAGSTGKYPAYYDADQLYDLSKDPGELVNLTNNPDYEDILNEMKEELKLYLNALPGTFGELKTTK